MRRIQGATLALVISAHSVAVADPNEPQVSPVHLQREDAQRLADQQRGLDHENPPPGATGAAARSQQGVPEPSGDSGKRLTGLVLLGASGVAVLGSLALIATAPSDTTGSSNSNSALAGLTLVTSLLAGVAGVALVVSSKSSVRIAPTVTSRAAGLSLSGRM
jgi:hypothetical protein